MQHKAVTSKHMKNPDPKLKHIFVGKDGTATVVCEMCGRAKKLSGINSKMMTKPVAVTCPCGNSFRIVFDARRHYRKDVRFRGDFRLEEESRSYPMIVENISFSGIGIRSPFVNKLKVGDKVVVNFRLDDTHKSLIDRLAIVRHVENDCAGLEFVADRIYDKILGFYLLK